jgi:glutathione reductase (NADPH)
MSELDALIIGTGTAGQTAAYALKKRGLTVGMADLSETPGGVCALAGCQAKKWFYEATEAVARATHLTGKGLDAPPSADWGVIRDQKNEFTSGVPEGTLSGLRNAEIEFFPGRAEFADARTMTVNGLVVPAKAYVLATGARPAPLPIDGAEHAITSDRFLELAAIPERVTFIGGGFISFEFAHFAARLGGRAGEIHVLEGGPRPLGPFDAEMVELLVRASEDEGIRVHTGVRVTGVETHGEGYRVHLDSGEEIETDLVVHGAGRAPNVESLGLDAAGIDFHRRGVVVNEQMSTTNAKVWAVGDCAATIQLARIADQEAHVAAAAIAKVPGEPMSYDTVAAVLFTYPQYGMVGRTEDDLKKNDVPYRRSFAKNVSWPTFRRIGLTHAAYKILVGEDGRLLGAHILSDNPAGPINTVRIAMNAGRSVEELHRESVLAPYPTRDSDLTYMLASLVD